MYIYVKSYQVTTFEGRAGSRGGWPTALAFYRLLVCSCFCRLVLSRPPAAIRSRHARERPGQSNPHLRVSRHRTLGSPPPPPPPSPPFAGSKIRNGRSLSTFVFCLSLSHSLFRSLSLSRSVSPLSLSLSVYIYIYGRTGILQPWCFKHNDKHGYIALMG